MQPERSVRLVALWIRGRNTAEMEQGTRHLLVNLEQMGFHAKLDFLSPYCIDKAEVCGQMAGSPMFCLTE